MDAGLWCYPPPRFAWGPFSSTQPGPPSHLQLAFRFVRAWPFLNCNEDPPGTVFLAFAGAGCQGSFLKPGEKRGLVSQVNHACVISPVASGPLDSLKLVQGPQLRAPLAALGRWLPLPLLLMPPRGAGSPWARRPQAAPELRDRGLLLLLLPEGPQLHFRPRADRVGRASSAPASHDFAAPVVCARSDKSKFLRVCRAVGRPRLRHPAGDPCPSLPHVPTASRCLLTEDPSVSHRCAAT